MPPAIAPIYSASSPKLRPCLIAMLATACAAPTAAAPTAVEVPPSATANEALTADDGHGSSGIAPAAPVDFGAELRAAEEASGRSSPPNAHRDAQLDTEPDTEPTAGSPTPARVQPSAPPSVPPPPPSAPSPERFRAALSGAPSRGARAPLVTIVEFADFQCPFCGRAAATMNRLLETFPDEVRLVFRHMPLAFHPRAMPASEAAIEAFRQGGDRKFWEIADRFFADPTALSDADITAHGAAVGLSAPGLEQALRQHRHRRRIAADMEMAAQLGVRGTPHFFLNGRRMAGAQPYEAFAAVVREEIAHAERLMQQGIARPALYAHMLQGATAVVTPPEPPPTAQQAPDPDDGVRYEVAERATAPSRGSRRAAVTIVTFSDFQCPFCSRAEPTIARLLRTYPRQVRVIFRHYPLPFHRYAFPAAEAAEEIRAQRGDAAFFRYHDLLFANQQALSRNDLENYARQIPGIDLPRFRAALDQRLHQATVQGDIDAVADAGARIGTPAFFINGRLMQGAQPYENFRDAVEGALGRGRP